VLVDLERFVCPTPDGSCRQTVGAVPLRPDGVHYRNASARRIARWILDRIGSATGGTTTTTTTAPG
jgi:hypothetical protein